MEPEDPQSEDQDGSGLGGPWKSQLTAKRVLAAMLGVAILAALAGIIANVGGEPELSLTPTTLADATRPPSTEAQTAVVGHQIPPIDGCTLISDDEILLALEVPDDTGFFRFSGGEGCVWQPDIGDEEEEEEEEEALSVELGPGSPSDFEDGATINDATGVPVPNVGDVAVWFGSDGAGTLSAVRQTDIGFLFMRLAINRPDINDQERLQLASSLITSAMDLTEFGPPPPVEANLCELVTDDEAEALLAPHREGRPAARDPLFIIDNFTGPVDLTQMGEFSCTKLIFTEIYVTVESASETDFGDDANVNGVPGEQVAGVGDVAMWFEDVPQSGPFASPHEIDVMAVGWEDARFRIVIALPDLAADEQFETAKELARKALGRLPGGPGELIIVEREVPDLSNLGFVDNLLAKESAGEWSYEEGLIATLKLFVGELADSDVLRHSELLDYSGTGLISLAQEYVETESDGPAKEEITRLLDLLIPSFGSQAPPEVSLSLTVALDSFFYSGPIAQEEPPEEEEPPPDDGEDQGYAPPPESDEGGFEYPDLPPEPGECANNEPFLDGWTLSGYEMPQFGPWTGAVLFPDEGLEGGWNRETHLLWALEALTDSIAEYGPPPVCLRLLLSHHGGSYTFVEQRLNPSTCLVFINKPMQNRNQDHFKQQLAADIAHCYFPWAFPNQYDVTYLTRRWWNHALAEFLSNVVYPAVNLEWRLSNSMAAQETSLPLVEREAGNWMFFQQVANEVGKEGVGTIILALPGGNDTFLDELTLADLPEMNEFYHEFSQLMTDAAIKDTGGGFIPYKPNKVTKQISGKGTHQEDLTPFQVTRWEVSVPSGLYACITGQKSGEALVSYRPGTAGAGTAGGWSELPEEEAPFSDDFVVVATTVRDGQEFSLVVRDVHEEPDCEDEEEEEEEEETPPEPCLCDPSAYFLVFTDIPDILKELLSPSG